MRQVPSDLVVLDALDPILSKSMPVVYTKNQVRYTSTKHLNEFFSKPEKVKFLQLERLERNRKILNVGNML